MVLDLGHDVLRALHRNWNAPKVRNLNLLLELLCEAQVRDLVLLLELLLVNIMMKLLLLTRLSSAQSGPCWEGVVVVNLRLSLLK